jgi:hypothetical protein
MFAAKQVAVAVLLLCVVARAQDGGYDDFGGYDGVETKTFEMNLDFVDVASFNETQFALDLQATTNQTDVTIFSVEYTVSTTVSFSVTVTESEAKTVLAATMNVQTGNITLAITPGRRLLSSEDVARRLASDVDASITVTDFEDAQAVQTIAQNTNDTQAALVAELNSTFNKIATASLGAVTASVKAITSISGYNVPAIEGSVLAELDIAVTSMGGDLGTVTDTTNGSPTPPPTAAPTPSVDVDEQEDSACTLGANALVLVAVAVALQEFA